MINSKSLQSDLKQIIREPILIIFLLVPLMAFIFIKIAYIYFIPYIYTKTGFNLSLYNHYVLALFLVMIPSMLGTVFGFLMLDEKDSGITELMVVTPAGYSGYLFNRLILPFCASFIYTFLGYYILNIYTLSFARLLLLALLLGTESLFIGITLFLLADDKVKGLTYAKGLSLVMLFTLADLVSEKWVRFFASLFPFYWISKVISSYQLEPSITPIGLAILLHGLWLIIFIRIMK